MNGDREMKRPKQVRKRMRGMFKTKGGKAVGIVSIAAPVIGFLVKDIQRPDGLVRSVALPFLSKLIAPKPKEYEAIDITDEVEILEADDKKPIDKKEV